MSGITLFRRSIVETYWYLRNNKINEIISGSAVQPSSQQWRLPPAFSTSPTAVLPLHSPLTTSLVVHANTSLLHTDSPLSHSSPTITTPQNSSLSINLPFPRRLISPSPVATSTASYSALKTPHSAGISPPGQHLLIKEIGSAELGITIRRSQW